MIKKLTSQQVDSRIRGNDSALVHSETLLMRFPFNQNCHSEVLRGIPLNFALCNRNYFPRATETHPLRSLRLCGSAPSEVAHA